MLRSPPIIALVIIQAPIPNPKPYRSLKGTLKDPLKSSIGNYSSITFREVKNRPPGSPEGAGVVPFLGPRDFAGLVNSLGLRV